MSALDAPLALQQLEARLQAALSDNAALLKVTQHAGLQRPPVLHLQHLTSLTPPRPSTNATPSSKIRSCRSGRQYRVTRLPLRRTHAVSQLSEFVRSDPAAATPSDACPQQQQQQ
jgi:hypothetical protein